MRKFLKVAACGLIMAAVVTGCSKKAAEETTPAETTTETTAEAGSETEASEQLEMMDLSGIDNGTVTLGEYKGCLLYTSHRLYTDWKMGIYGDLYGESAGLDRGMYSIMALLSDTDS